MAAKSLSFLTAKRPAKQLRKLQDIFNKVSWYCAAKPDIAAPFVNRLGFSFGTAQTQLHGSAATQ
jgi:hypothetical protein